MLIKDRKGRTDGNSGYSRVFGDEDLGKLLSRVHATSISNGTELERLVIERANTIKDLDDFIDKATEDEIKDGSYVCQKKVLKSSKKYYPDEVHNIEPDLLVFIVQKRRVCKVIELKDGDNFDTKKAQGEFEHLRDFSKAFGPIIPFVVEFYICCFHQNDKEKIKIGFKNRFPLENIMTGQEFCKVLNINYEEIIQIRKNDQKDNLNYFLKELYSIEKCKKIIKKL